MYKDEVVKIMTDAIDNFNRYQGQMNNIPEDQIEQFIKQGREQMEFVNGMLYDLLIDNGVIHNG